MVVLAFQKVVIDVPWRLSGQDGLKRCLSRIVVARFA